MDGESPPPADVTRILHEWKDGSREALDRLIPLVYEELRTIASRQLAREWRHDRLQTTTVVNEAYVKLFAQRRNRWLAAPLIWSRQPRQRTSQTQDSDTSSRWRTQPWAISLMPVPVPAHC